MYHTVVSHSWNQNPCVFSVEVHGPATAVIQIKAGHTLHLASLFHQPLGNGAAKERGLSALEPNPVDLFIRCLLYTSGVGFHLAGNYDSLSHKGIILLPVFAVFYHSRL